MRAARPGDARRAFARYLREQPGGTSREAARVSICRIDAGAGRFADAAACYAAYLAEFPRGTFAEEARRAASVAGEESKKAP